MLLWRNYLLKSFWIEGTEVFDFLPPVFIICHQNIFLKKKFVTKFGTKRTKKLILLRKSGSGGWDRTNDHSVIPGHKVSYL